MSGKPLRQRHLLLLAFGMTLLSVAFLRTSAPIGATVGAFIAAASAYTALDLVATIKTTGTMPAGQYCEADRKRYRNAAVQMFLLLVAVFIREHISGLNLELATGLLAPGIVALFAIVIAGMKGNKIATRNGPGESDTASGL